MSEILHAARKALADIWQPRMLALAIWPMLLAVVAWTGLAWLFWDQWTRWIAAALTGVVPAGWPLAAGIAGLAPYAAWFLIALVLVPFVIASAGLVTAVLAMPLIVGFVAARDYPRLERRRGGSFAGSLLNGVVAIGGFVLLWLVTLPLWLIVALAPFLPFALAGYLQQRLFRYDALAEHADATELRVLIRDCRGRLFALGCLVALLYAVPLANLLAPVVSGLAFTHFLLGALEKKRGAAGAPPIVAES